MLSKPTTIEQIDAWRAVKSETEQLEFKEAKNQFAFDSLADYCVAIANERGGNLVLGVANKPPRPVVGTKAYLDTSKVSQDLFIALHFRVDVEEVNHPNGRVLVFHIPSRPPRHPYEHKGQYWMRVGESLVPMTTDQIDQILKEDVPRYNTAISIPRKRGIYIVSSLLLTISFLLFLYWGAFHRPRQRDVEVGTLSETHPTTDMPTVVKQPDQNSNTETHGTSDSKQPPAPPPTKKKKPKTPKEPPTSQVVTSPDPYVGVSNKQVSQWVMDEADRIEKMENDCRDGVLKAQQQKAKGLPYNLPYNSFDAPGPEAVQSRFRRDFDTSVKPELVKLHNSLNFRLGPAARTRIQEQDYQNIMSFSLPPNHSWELCMMVGTYARDLRQMATSLNNQP